MTILATAGLALAGGGCATEETWTTDPAKTTLVPTGVSSRTTEFSAGALPLGSVPYDNRSLPLVSPGGHYVATQVGTPPPWETLLAEKDAVRPQDTNVEIYGLDRRLGRATRHWATGPSILLGRAGDDGGFLVESIRPDGARWIGYAGWLDRDITWLVADDQVNAFASLGRDGRLAWSRRGGNAEHFDLGIRRDGAEWTVGAQGGDWLLPTWSTESEGLFALRLTDGKLEAMFLAAESPQTTGQTVVRLPLAEGMTRRDAYQCLASQVVTTGVPRFEATHLLLWHPTSQRIALWRPSSSPGAATLLLAGSIAAVVDKSAHALVATTTQLALQNLADLSQRRVLLPGT